MNRIPKGLRVIVVGGLHHRRRGVTLSEVYSCFEKIKVRLDGSPPEDAWVNAYLLDREDWEDNPVGRGPEVVAFFEKE